MLYMCDILSRQGLDRLARELGGRGRGAVYYLILDIVICLLIIGLTLIHNSIVDIILNVCKRESEYIANSLWMCIPTPTRPITTIPSQLESLSPFPLIEYSEFNQAKSPGPNESGNSYRYKSVNTKSNRKKETRGEEKTYLLDS